MGLREGLIRTARERALTANQETAKEVIFRYVTGQPASAGIRGVTLWGAKVKGTWGGVRADDPSRRPMASSGTGNWMQRSGRWSGSGRAGKSGNRHSPVARRLVDIGRVSAAENRSPANMNHVAGIRGALEGYAGKTLPALEGLRLEEIGGE